MSPNYLPGLRSVPMMVPVLFWVVVNEWTKHTIIRTRSHEEAVDALQTARVRCDDEQITLFAEVDE